MVAVDIEEKGACIGESVDRMKDQESPGCNGQGIHCYIDRQDLGSLLCCWNRWNGLGRCQHSAGCNYHSEASGC